jgi:hypothetical protein
MDTVVHWAKAHGGWPIVVAFCGPCHLVHGQSAPRAGGGVLTGDAVGTMVVDNVEGGNDFKVGKGAPSLAPKLHMSGMDIRPCLTDDEK